MKLVEKRKVSSKRRIDFLRLSIVFLSFVGVLYIFSAVFIENMNTNLTIEIQKTQSQIAEVEVANQALESDIQNLTKKSRVETMANDAGLSYSKDNVISVMVGD